MGDAVRDFVQAFADEPCAYGDDCPPFGTRHGTCHNCAARRALGPPGGSPKGGEPA